MKVLLLSRYGHRGASSRMRSYQYLPYLRSQDINVTVAPLMNDEYVARLYAKKRVKFLSTIGAYMRRVKSLLLKNEYDLLWVEYEVLPWLPGLIEVWFMDKSIPYIVDYDDAVFHRYDMFPNFWVRYFLGGKIDHIMREASAVIVGNQYLADRAYAAGASRVEHIPTVVDLARYSLKPRLGDKPFTIGWIGSPTTKKYLHLISSALAEVCADDRARIVLVGSGPCELKGVPCEIRTWSEETEVADIQSFDVGVMPLTDGPWERGKCGYKLIQYMANGLPVVASPVGVNQQIVEEGVNGFLATTTDCWVRALVKLRDDMSLRTTLGRAGRAKVEAQYCLQVTAPKLVSIFRTIKNTRACAA